jgi:hypothetical protein
VPEWQLRKVQREIDRCHRLMHPQSGSHDTARGHGKGRAVGRRRGPDSPGPGRLLLRSSTTPRADVRALTATPPQLLL